MRPLVTHQRWHRPLLTSAAARASTQIHRHLDHVGHHVLDSLANVGDLDPLAAAYIEPTSTAYRTYVRYVEGSGTFWRAASERRLPRRISRGSWPVHTG